MKYYKQIFSAVSLLILMCGNQVLSAKNESSSYNFSRALEEAEMGNKQSAMDFFKKELSENPQNGYAHMALASFHLDNSEYGEARSAVELAIKFLPKKDKQSISNSYVIRSQLLAIEKDTVGAYSDLALSVKIYPNNADAYEKRGQLYFEQQRYDESDMDYRKLMELNPGDVMGRMGLGRNANARKDYKSAIEQYDKVIALYPDYSSGYSFRAEAYLGAGEYLKAIDDICKALEIDSDAKAHYLLFKFPIEQTTLIVIKMKGLSAKYPHTGEYDYYTAQIYNKRRMYKDAIESLEKAFDKDAQSFILEKMAESYAEMGDFANALSTVERALQMTPDDEDLWILKADALGFSGDIEGAITEWSRYIENNPDFFYGYYRRGFYEDNAERTDEALADYDMAIMLEPTFAYAYLGRGDMLMKKSDTEKAMEAYTKVVELDTVPSSGSCAMYALLALGKRAEAVSFMEEIIASDTIEPGNFYDAACFTCRLGDTTKAMEYLRTALEKGFRRIYHIRKDDDLEPLRALPEFEELLRPYENIVSPVSESESSDSGQSNATMSDSVEIPFTQAGGVTEVSCKINNLPLNFIFDTGASIVSLSMVEANFMMKNGYLKFNDVVGSGNFLDANGDISEGTIVNLRQLDFGGIILENVKASVVKNQKAPLLLGQSVLGRLGKIEIDNKNKKLIIFPNR